jgi:hypothetical protein
MEDAELLDTAVEGAATPLTRARAYPIMKVTTPVPVEGAWKVAHSR